MIRSLDLKAALKVQGLLKSFRLLSAQAATAAMTHEVKFKDEWNNAKDYDSLPGMTKFEAIRAFLPGGKYYNTQMIEMQKLVGEEYGKVCKFPAMLGRPEMVWVFAPEDAEKVFRFDGQYPFRRSLETLSHYRKTVRPDIFGEFGGLIAEQGEEWWRMRTVVNPVMMKPTVVKLYVPQVDDIAKEFVAMISKLRDGKNEVPGNFNDLLNMWSLESITCISLNRRIGLLKPNFVDDKAEQLIKLIRKFFEVAYEFEVKPSIWRIYKTKAFKELLETYDGLTNIIEYYVDKAVEDLDKLPPVEGREESILEKLVKVNKKVAIVMVSEAMLAGVDTTSSAAIGILYCLAKNQDKQEKLREELRTLFPNKDEPLTTEKMKNMPYLRACIKEGIRLFPPAAGTARRVENDVVLGGYKVPKGTECMMSLVGLLTDESQFAQADKFIPERWLKNNTDASCPHAKDAHPFAYLPFGFGSRMCIGKRLAELEIEVLVTRMLQNYQVEWHHPDMKIKSVLVNIPDCELKFTLKDVQY